MNKNKILITVLVIIIVIVLLVGISYMVRKGNVTVTPGVETPEVEEEAPAVEEGAVEEPAVEEGGDIGKMNDDLYVEILAQSTYMAGEDPAAWMVNGWDKLLEKYGVTQEQWEAYADEVESDPQRFNELTARLYERVQELSE